MIGPRLSEQKAHCEAGSWGRPPTDPHPQSQNQSQGARFVSVVISFPPSPEARPGETQEFSLSLVRTVFWASGRTGGVRKPHGEPAPP